MSEDPFWDVIDDGVEADKITVIEASDFTVAEIIPGMWEIVATESSEFADMKSVLENFFDLELTEPGNYIVTNWWELEDGRLCCLLFRK